MAGLLLLVHGAPILRLSGLFAVAAAAAPRRSVRIRARAGGDGDGDKESEQILRAFFVGKAFAEAVNERIGSAVGEFLSEIGRRQAEQQKLVRDFQEEVEERARTAMLDASRRQEQEKQLAAPTEDDAAS